MIKCWMILLLLLNVGWAATPFQAITAKDGWLIYEDGSEVNLFGVNYQPMLVGSMLRGCIIKVY